MCTVTATAYVNWIIYATFPASRFLAAIGTKTALSIIKQPSMECCCNYRRCLQAIQSWALPLAGHCEWGQCSSAYFGSALLLHPGNFSLVPCYCYTDSIQPHSNVQGQRVMYICRRVEMWVKTQVHISDRKMSLDNGIFFSGKWWKPWIRWWGIIPL